ncbi:hypothetical protein [Luteimonas sp. gir]|uniref:hypothetical protein n=1 Tax=Luteimonas sp. gir TaxID=3127960 RepID=UPI003075E186
MSDTQPPLHTRLAADLGPTLEWLHKRAWPIGGIGLVATLVCLLHYARQERIPLDLTSPSVITAVPVLFALIVLASALLSLIFLTPSWLLSWSLYVGDPPLGESLKPLDANPKAAKKMLAARRRLGFGWIGTSIAQALTLLLVGQLTETWPPGLSVLTSALATVMLGALVVLQIPPQPTRRWSFSTYWNALAIAFAQLVCMLSLLLLYPRHAPDWPTTLSMAAATLVMVSIVQLGTYQFVQRLRCRPHPLGEALAAGAVLMLLVTIAIPPAGSALASFALRAPLTGGAACVQITWVPDRAPEGVDRRLRVVAPAGDTLLVQRPGAPETTYFIRRDAILAMAGIDCRDAEQRANDEQAQAAQDLH